VALARAIVMIRSSSMTSRSWGSIPSRSSDSAFDQSNERAFGDTSVVVSHDVRSWAAIADDSYLLSGGRVVASGTPQELAKERFGGGPQFMTAPRMAGGLSYPRRLCPAAADG